MAFVTWEHILFGALFGLSCWACALTFRNWRRARRERQELLDRIRRRGLVVMDLGLTDVPGCETRTLRLRPERSFRIACGESGLPWIRITEVEAFVVEAVTVGKSLIAHGQPAAAFLSQSAYWPGWDATEPSKVITLTVRNIDTRPRTLAGMVMGFVESPQLRPALRRAVDSLEVSGDELEGGP